MAVVTTKSQSITNLDSTPIVMNTAGEGAPSPLVHVNDTLAVATTDSIGSTYKFVRIPTNAHVKNVWFDSVAIAALAGDVNVAFSDSAVDGTPVSLQGTIPQISAANNKLFGAAEALAAALHTNITHANITNYPLGSSNQPLWEVLGYASDPGGMFDIEVVSTTAATTGGTLGLHVEYCVPGLG